MYRSIIFKVFAIVILLSCSKHADIIDVNTSSKIVFKTDFEEETIAEPENAIGLIKVNNSNSLINFMSVFYEGGEELDRHARIVTDPSGINSNNALHFWLKNATIDNPPFQSKKGRIQSVLIPNEEITNLVQTHRMFLHTDLEHYKTYPNENSFFVINELWVGVPWENHPFPFLMGLRIVKPEGINTPLYFSISARVYNYETQKWNETIWGEVNFDYPVPLGEWLDVVLEYKQGNSSNGKYVFKIKRENNANYETIFDVTDWTYNPNSPEPVPVTHLNPLKLYTSERILNHLKANSGVAQIYWDDLEITTVE